MSANEKPATLNLGTIASFLCLIFAGFSAWSAMQREIQAVSGRVDAVESKVQTLARASDVDRILDLLCSDAANQEKRACK